MRETETNGLTEMLRRHDRDRFLTTLFAPAARRPELWAVLAFNHEIARVRETVSQPILGQIRLQWWRDAIEEIYAGKPPRRHETAEPLADAIRGRGLKRRHFDTLIDARERDLDETPPATLAELDAYAAASAGTLFELMADILAPDLTPAGLAAARAVGTGWGLVGLIRAVPFHLASGRIFIPDELGLDAATLQAQQFSPSLGAALARIADAARRHLAAARAARRTIAGAALPALLPARLVDHYLKRLAASGYDPYRAEVQQPDPLAVWRLGVGRLISRF